MRDVYSRNNYEILLNYLEIVFGWRVNWSNFVYLVLLSSVTSESFIQIGHKPGNAASGNTRENSCTSVCVSFLRFAFSIGAGSSAAVFAGGTKKPD